MGSEKLAEASRKLETAPEGKIWAFPQETLGLGDLSGLRTAYCIPLASSSPDPTFLSFPDRLQDKAGTRIKYLRELRGHLGGLPGGSGVKNPPVMQVIWVQSLGGEDPLEQQMAAHTSIIAWEIP